MKMLPCAFIPVELHRSEYYLFLKKKSLFRGSIFIREDLFYGTDWECGTDSDGQSGQHSSCLIVKPLWTET